MSFSSVSFFVFMIAVFLIYWGIPHKFKYMLLICANIAFYGSFGVKFIPVLLVEVIIAFVLAIAIENKKAEKKQTKLLICIGIILTVLPLLFFKYLNFAIYTVDKVLSKITVPVNDHTLKIIAPIGISFYTFELLSYIIDVYSGKTKAEKNILRLFVFASFFPNITSGPIERANSFLKQLDMEKEFNYDRSVSGLRLVMLGMVKKICGADVLKQYADVVFSNVYGYRGPIFIIAIILYTFEIYLDFSGYTDMARGFARMLGFELTENFKSPYLSASVSEFWRRWHISLSQWLRDYIYIPLGGSRCSKIRKYINLMATFLVSGIWHGASFTFIVWGLLHGIYQCISDFVSNIVKNKANASKYNTDMQNNTQIRSDNSPLKWLKIAVTFVLVSYAWMFFRANSLTDAKYITMNMFSGDNFYGQMLQMGFLNVASYVGVILIIAITIAYDIYNEKLSICGTNIIEKFSQLKFIVRWAIYIILGVLIVVLRSHVGAGAEFIYFKF
ncbi:MAG: MBOAT family O-acyltransferase [Lachnospiraceae bacterium]|nr:MBOAT family O-acyltransferase [Lachnospiraceae bacterium]